MNHVIHLDHLRTERAPAMQSSLARLASKWRAEEEEQILPRHEYQPSNDALFTDTGPAEVVQADHVDQANKDSVLGPNHINRAGGSGGSGLTSVAGELTSWLQQGDQPVASAWGFTADQRRESLARLRQPAVPDLPGVPGEWCSGVYKLQTLPAPGGIDPHRWSRHQYDALRLLHEQGSELHAAGWEALDLFGLHRIAPDRRPDAMGVAWLMHHLVVVGITPDAVSLSTAAGVVMRATRLGRQARLEAVVTWVLGDVPGEHSGSHRTAGRFE